MTWTETIEDNRAVDALLKSGRFLLALPMVIFLCPHCRRYCRGQKNSECRNQQSFHLEFSSETAEQTDVDLPAAHGHCYTYPAVVSPCSVGIYSCERQRLS